MTRTLTANRRIEIGLYMLTRAAVDQVTFEAMRAEIMAEINKSHLKPTDPLKWVEIKQMVKGRDFIEYIIEVEI